MQYSLNSVVFQIRALLLTALIALAGFAFVTQLSDSSSYSDDTPRLRVIEVQEFLNDIEPPPHHDASPNFFVASFLFIFAATQLTSVLHRKKVIPRLTFLYHIQPRSPPLQ